MKIQESFLPSCYVCHVCLLKESEGDFDEPIEVDEDDEKAISVFMNQNPPVRQTLADVILEKIRDKKTELSTVMTGSVAPSIITKHILLNNLPPHTYTYVYLYIFCRKWSCFKTSNG